MKVLKVLFLGMSMVFVVNGFVFGQNNTYPWPQSGSIGIGTDSPRGTLDVNGQGYTGDLYIGNAGSPHNTIALQTEEKLWNIFNRGNKFDNSLTIYDTNTNTWAFYINGKTDNVGIGTAAPGAQLTLFGDGRLRLQQEGLVGQWDINADSSRNVLSIEYRENGVLDFIPMMFDSEKNVYFPQVPSSGGNYSLLLDQNNMIVANRSSRRYKKDIKPYTTNFSKILKVVPRSFVYKSSEESAMGYIAEDLDELGLHDLVVYDKEGKPDAIDNFLISVYAIEIIKEHETSIEILKAQNAELKAELERIKEKIFE